MFGNLQEADKLKYLFIQIDLPILMLQLYVTKYFVQ
jgi:hypothetical protein